MIGYKLSNEALDTSSVKYSKNSHHYTYINYIKYLL